jgi:outer membrane murein-binding lipoprotein Lpp
MKTGTKIIIGAVIVAGAGVAGYFGYKKYLESKAAENVTGLGAFTDGGYADYNARVAYKYWKRMSEMQRDRQRLQAVKGV